MLWLWDISGARKESCSLLVPCVDFGDHWYGGQWGEPELGVQQSCLASPCSCDQLWLHVPHRLLAVPSSPVPLPSPQQDLEESCLVGTEMMVEGRKKRIREEIGAKGKSGSVMPHWGRNHLLGLRNGSSLSLGKAIILQNLVGQLPSCCESGVTCSWELRIAPEEKASCSSHPLARHHVQSAHSKRC